MKYWFLFLNIFAMILAIKVYVNYLSIEDTINNTIVDRENKMQELAFTQNFMINYEKSDYARYFLSHENNMLWSNEYIIKFEEMTQKSNVVTWKNTYENQNIIKTPQQSRKRFLNEKIY